MWRQPYEPHPDHGAFKGALYAPIDPRFENFFREPLKASIRLDQVDWGGVTVNGIPPLAWISSGQGAAATITLPTGTFAVQSLWSNTFNSDAGGCVLSY